MKVSQYIWKEGQWELKGENLAKNPQLCLLFGTREEIEEGDYYNKLRSKYSNTEIVTCSTAGNIIGEELIDEVIIANCIELEHTRIETHLVPFSGDSGKSLGTKVGELINKEDLAYVLVLSTNKLNAGRFLTGVNEVIGGSAPVSGGVAGDNFKFEKTIVGLNETVEENSIVVVSFHGSRLHTYHSSRGGWDTFGPKRKVTKCDGNVLYEVDEKPVLDLYKEYLGEKSKELPGSALHFPLAIIDPVTKEYIVRGVQDIDEEKNALILFGDIPDGACIHLMRANFDRVIEGASSAAAESQKAELGEPDLSILISCVARRLVLDQLTEEELSEAKNALGDKTKICGFYSYSELSPIVGDNACHLHNQTMTITNFYER